MNNGILRVTEESKIDIDATGVKLHITIQGENFIFGNAAIEKCLDVKMAVSKITAVDKGASISVDGVAIRSETGWFAKGSKGAYRLTVRLGEMVAINEVLASIMELKNASMNSLEWEYDEFTAKVSLIEEAVTRCRKKAEAMALALGKTIVGTKTCSDSYIVPDDDNHYGIAAEGSAIKTFRLRASMDTADFGTEVRGKKQITAVATVEFYLSNNE